jgi:hypothetical protein
MTSASGPGQNDVGDAATTGPSREIMADRAIGPGRPTGSLATQAATIARNPGGTLARSG